MKNPKNLLIATIIALVASISYVYPQILCDRLIDFDTTPRDTFGLNFDNAGDLIFSESDIDVYIDSILWTNGLRGYYKAQIDTSWCGFGYDKVINISNISLIFDLAQATTDGVSFIFFDMGGDENLQVNGGPEHVINNFWQLPPDVAPDIICDVDTVAPDECEYTVIGKVNLYGVINTLRIAGQELWVDSLCVDDAVVISENPHQYSVNTLHQNYPNPFNISTKFLYTIAKEGFVNLKVYDMNGREIMVLVNEHQKENNYSVNFDGGYLPGGVYYYKLQIDDFVEVRKMLLVR
ncbi:MAG: T9SS type A sorting domain-containing protein [Bacteroidales bacterium]|nr:T9SS type A sorting domain-containing protein [Bacteroidales bacterium]